MIVVERGNRLPTVAVVQKLLNEKLGRSLSVDGRFNRPMLQAVRDFQRTNHIGADGIVGPNTWTRLSAGRSLAVIDHVDAADDYHDSPGYIGYERDLRRLGISPIVSYYQSGGIRSISSRIQQRAAATPGRVLLLRFHGHGGPGSMALSRGRGGIPHTNADAFSFSATDWPNICEHFGMINRIFAPMGSVELHGCNIAGEMYQNGHRIHGSDGVGIGPYFLQRLAQLWGVPVTASPNTQYSHGRSILRLEGRILTAYPDGHSSIESWARAKSL